METIKIPFSSPKWTVEEDLVAAVKKGTAAIDALRDGLVDMLRHEYPSSNILLVNRGRSAILFLLRLFGVGAGDEVILPSYLCSSVLEAIRKVKARPVLADIDADLNISPRAVERLISSKTRAIVVPHLFGYPAAIDEISQMAGSSIRVIDDAAQCYGSRLDGKMLGGCGDGGLVVCGPGKALAGPAGAAVLVDEKYGTKGISLSREPAWQVEMRYRKFVHEKVHRQAYLQRGRGNRYAGTVSRGILGVMNHYFSNDVYAISDTDTAIMFQQIHSNQRLLGDLRLRNYDEITSKIDIHHAVKPLRGDVAPIKVPFLCASRKERAALLCHLDRNGIEIHYPYTPIHMMFPKEIGSGHNLSYTDHIWDKLIHLPLDEQPGDTQYLIDGLTSFYH